MLASCEHPRLPGQLGAGGYTSVPRRAVLLALFFSSFFKPHSIP